MGKKELAENYILILRTGNSDGFPLEPGTAQQVPRISLPAQRVPRCLWWGGEAFLEAGLELVPVQAAADENDLGQALLALFPGVG